MRSCGRKRELFKACHKATVWLFFFFSADCEMRWKVFSFYSLTLAACLGENQGKAEVWILIRLPFSFLFGNNSLEGLAENVGARVRCLLTIWPNLSRPTIELLGIAFTEARLQGKLVRLWDGTKPHGLDGLSAWGGGTCTTCQQSSGSDSLRRMCFWHSSGPYARPLQITDRNRWDSIPSVSIRILPAGTTSNKEGCRCFLCSNQQWWCQYINLNHQIIGFIFLELILFMNWILLIKALVSPNCNTSYCNTVIIVSLNSNEQNNFIFAWKSSNKFYLLRTKKKMEKHAGANKHISVNQSVSKTQFIQHFSYSKQDKPIIISVNTVIEMEIKEQQKLLYQRKKNFD